MSKNGRPRILDEVKQAQVCTLVQTGYSIDKAAEFVGCSAVTIRREANRNNDFKERLQRSEGVCEFGPLEALHKMAKTDWRAAAWLLERIDPERFTKPDVKRLEIRHLHSVVRGLLDAVADEVNDDTDCQRVFDRVGELAFIVANELDKSPAQTRRVQFLPWLNMGFPGTEFTAENWRKDLAMERDFEELRNNGPLQRIRAASSSMASNPPTASSL